MYQHRPHDEEAVLPWESAPEDAFGVDGVDVLDVEVVHELEDKAGEDRGEAEAWEKLIQFYLFIYLFIYF